MAFDQSTRNRLQKFVNDARDLLTEEFTRQLQATYGLDPKAGSVAAVDSLTHLDNRQRQTAHILRDTLAHYLASTHGRSETDRKQQALTRIVREQAFTVLNRLAALRMAEARGFLLESIAKGYNSKGFQLYKQLAGSAHGETGEAYRNYLYSVFDEFSLDLAVLFDRHSAQGRLFPRESALLELLDLINHFEIDPLWAEDETIGWIYQYFNSQEERRKMRTASQAPRNSRELAVRNQFFTPRYVVEFLTDNTLGRIWYEMTKGNTRLVDNCRYLVRRPTEIFIKPEEHPPEQDDITGNESLSQEELLKQPVYIPHRAMKDPRCIRMLDPACGSMHFGLYAFDLYGRIYEEAWQLEAELGAETFLREGDLKPLHQTYESFENYKIEIPRLIIEHNIHGVDIDPRAVQIAGLSLWQRAQRAWQQQGIKPQQRPVVRKSNIVCAEPMPGEKAILQEFGRSLNPPVLGQLLEAIFDKMELAAEAGSLLKIEEEIQSSIRQARDQWQTQAGTHSVGDMFQVDLDQATPQNKLTFDLSGVDDVSFWDGAEQLILAALSDYADRAESNADQKRLFAEDAAKGFAFIDLCRKRFDVVLMNPPFGSFSKLWTTQSRIAYPNSYNDILGAFVDRFIHRLDGSGLLGAITSRTCFFLSSFKSWRKNVVLKDSAVRVIVDLGQGVMDDAMVEAAAYVLESTTPASNMTVFRGIADVDRQAAIESCLDAHNAAEVESRLFLADQKKFGLLEDAPFVYWVDPQTIRQFDTGSHFEPDLGMVRVGLQTGDDFRFVRAGWEVSPEDTISPDCLNSDLSFGKGLSCEHIKTNSFQFDLSKTWCYHVKAGASQPWFTPLTLKVNFKNSGAEMLGALNANGKPRAVLRSPEFYFRPGFSWTRRAVRFYPYVIPSGAIASTGRYMAFPRHGKQAEALAVCASRLVSAFLRFYAEFWQRPNFLVDTLKSLPWPELPDEAKAHFDKLIRREVQQRRLAYQNHEPFQEFLLPGKLHDFSNGGQALAFDTKSLLDAETENMIADAFGFTKEQTQIVERDLLEAISYQQDGGTSSSGQSDESDEDEEDSDFFLDYSKSALEEANLSYLLGTTFGRWDIRYATGESQLPELPDPFDPLPICPPGMLQNADHLPVAPADVPDDYPLRITWPGILVDDDGHSEDIVARVRNALSVIWDGRATAIEQEACDVLDVRALRDYFAEKKTGGMFFKAHLKRYSKSRRQAPIYWPLSTKTGSYTLWCYYHQLNNQTLYTCINDYIEPKLRDLTNELQGQRSKSARTSQDERELARLFDLETDLKDFRDELLRVTNFWKPNLNDGVQITAAPLWKLFQNKTWQKKLKETWERLENGDYDWAHLAYSIWPERVLRKCLEDRSLAIAHDVESIFWRQVKVPIRRGKKAASETKLKWQPKALSDVELNALIQAKIKEINA